MTDFASLVKREEPLDGRLQRGPPPFIDCSRIRQNSRLSELKKADAVECKQTKNHFDFANYISLSEGEETTEVKKKRKKRRKKR